MIIECACKKYKFAVKAEEIGINGRVVQCGVCDQKWFQEPASSEEFKVLKEIQIKEEEEKKEKAKNQKPIKEKSGKNYVPIIPTIKSTKPVIKLIKCLFLFWYKSFYNI